MKRLSRRLVQLGRKLKAQSPLLLLLLLYTAFFASLIFSTSHGGLADEEAEVPIVAEWLASGMPFELLPRMQYMRFCGGCTAEAVMAWPVFAVFGPSLLAWKSIPLFFGLALVTLTVLIGRHVAPGVGILAGLLLLLSPPFFFANSIIAHGNHFEASVFVMGAILLALRYRDGPSPLRAGSLGLTLGAGLWFCYSSGFAIPVVLLLACRRRSFRLRSFLGRLMAGLCGALLGFMPWLLTHNSEAFTKRFGAEAHLSVYEVEVGDLVTKTIAGFNDRWPYLVGDTWWQSLWQPAVVGNAAGAGLPWFLAEVVCVLALGVLALRQLLRGQGGRKQLSIEGGLFLLLVAFAGVFLLLAPVPDYSLTLPAGNNDLRYLMPLIPILCLAFAVCAHHCWQAGERWRWVGVLLLVKVGGPGLMARTGELYSHNYGIRPLYLPSADPWTGSGRSAWESLTPVSAQGPGSQEPTMPPPERPLARRSYSYSIGSRVPLQIELPPDGLKERRQFLAWLKGQPRLQQRTALVAFSRGLFGQSEINAPLAPQASWLLDELGPEFAGQALELAGTRDRAPLQEVVKLRDRKAKLTDLPLNNLPEVQRAAVAWAIGFGLATEFARSSNFEDEQMTAGPWQEGFEGPLASQSWAGFGEAVGRRWGYSNAIRARFLRAVPTQWTAAADRGFQDGREWVFLP